MLIKYIKNNKGMAFALILMVFAVVSIIATTSLTISLSQTKLGMGTENHSEAYYIARAATDIVSTDILNQIKTLDEKVPHALSTQDELDEYDDLVTKFNSILKTSTIQVNGMGVEYPSIDTNILVESSLLNPDNKNVIIETVFVRDGKSAKAKVKLGKISIDTTTTAISGNQFAINSWGDLSIGTKLVLPDGGTVGYGIDNPEIKKNNTVSATKTSIDIDIITPPAFYDVIKNSEDLSSTSFSTEHAKNINKTDNGNYEDLGFGNKDYLNLNVDTGAGEEDSVILIFSSFSVTNNSKINVTGKGNLYIYLVEDTTTSEDSSVSLFNAKNDFDITGKNGDAPQTYIISYTRAMQDLSTQGIATTTNDQLKEFDTAFIKNSSTLDVFFYLPGVEFEIFQGNPFITGTIFSSGFKIGNSATVNFKHFPPDSILSSLSDIGTITKEIKVVSIEPADLSSLNKIWIQ